MLVGLPSALAVPGEMPHHSRTTPRTTADHLRHVAQYGRAVGEATETVRASAQEVTLSDPLDYISCGCAVWSTWRNEDSNQTSRLSNE
jgi:hypothetical protein